MMKLMMTMMMREILIDGVENGPGITAHVLRSFFFFSVVVTKYFNTKAT